MRGMGTVIGFLGSRRHGRLRELLSSYIDGQVDNSEASRVELHLGQCEDCRVELESLRATVGLLQSLPELELPRSFELSEAAVRVATREPAKVEFAPSIVWTTRLATSAAAALVVILFVGDVTGIVKQTETPVSVAILERAVMQAEVPVETVVEHEVVVEKEVVKEVVELESAPVVEAAAESAVAVEEVVGAVTVEADTTEAVEMEAASPTPAALPTPGVAEAAAPKAEPVRPEEPEALAVVEAQTSAREPAEESLRPRPQGVEMRLWQLDVAVGSILGVLALATVWIWRRGKLWVS